MSQKIIFPNNAPSTVGMKTNIPGISMKKFTTDVVGQCSPIVSGAFQTKGRRVGQLPV